jgi:peptidoglycan hydrolase-like protein with peptidoglycan-binding domain
MTSRCPGLILIGCLACLDVLSRPTVGFAQSVVPRAGERLLASGLLASQGSAMAQISPHVATLALGSQGPEVVELQKTLKLLGYFEGEVNGVYTASTAASVSQFQQAVKLPRATVSPMSVAQMSVAQVSASKPAKKNELPIWLYGLGGAGAVAAGVAVLRLSSRPRPMPLQPAPHHAPNPRVASPQATLTSPGKGMEKPFEPVDKPKVPPSDRVAEPSIEPNQIPPKPTFGEETVIQVSESLASPPMAKPSFGEETVIQLPASFASQPAHEAERGAAVPQGELSGELSGVSAAAAQAKRNGTSVAVAAQSVANGHATPTSSAQPSPAPASPAPSQSLTTEPPLLETTRLAKINIVEELMRDLRSADATKRHKVIWELSHRGDTRAVQPLVDLLVDSDSKQRSLILSALSEIGTRTLRPMSRALAISLQDESADVRKNAIRDLTRVYDMVAQISQLLHKATDDPDAEVQETARWALGQLNRIRSVPEAPTLKNSVSPPENLP